MDQSKKTGRPMVLTFNGRAAVVQDAEAYQRLLDLAADTSVVEGIRQGLDHIEQGRTRLASDVFDAIRSTRDIPRWTDRSRRRKQL